MGNPHLHKHYDRLRAELISVDFYKNKALFSLVFLLHKKNEYLKIKVFKSVYKKV